MNWTTIAIASIYGTAGVVCCAIVMGRLEKMLIRVEYFFRELFKEEFLPQPTQESTNDPSDTNSLGY